MSFRSTEVLVVPVVHDGHGIDDDGAIGKRDLPVYYCLIANSWCERTVLGHFWRILQRSLRLVPTAGTTTCPGGDSARTLGGTSWPNRREVRVGGSVAGWRGQVVAPTLEPPRALSPGTARTSCCHLGHGAVMTDSV
jgi:hypothetical protein